MKSLILASASPRRKELLQQIGVRFTQVSVDLDESVLPNETPEMYVLRLACEKSKVGHERFADSPSVGVLGSDTSVVINGAILGKPENEEEAVSMLMRLSGKTHDVITGVALTILGETKELVVSTKVTFKTLNEAQCRRYWLTGEPQDKAGGYGIQGLGAVFVDKIEGSYSSVVGLPLAETAELLEENGIQYWT